MTNSEQFLFTAYALCILISIASLIVTLFFVIPLQLKKAGVQNGLSSLRHKQLAKGVLSLVMSIMSVVVLTSRFFLEGEIIRYLNTTLIFFFTIFWFMKEMIESSIYHTQFTEDQIQFHQKIHKEEVKQKISSDRREVARLKLNATRRKATATRHSLLK